MAEAESRSGAKPPPSRMPVYDRAIGVRLPMRARHHLTQTTSGANWRWRAALHDGRRAHRGAARPSDWQATAARRRFGLSAPTYRPKPDRRSRHDGAAVWIVYTPETPNDRHVRQPRQS